MYRDTNHITTETCDERLRQKTSGKGEKVENKKKKKKTRNNRKGERPEACTEQHLSIRHVLARHWLGESRIGRVKLLDPRNTAMTRRLACRQRKLPDCSPT